MIEIAIARPEEAVGSEEVTEAIRRLAVSMAPAATTIETEVLMRICQDLVRAGGYASLRAFLGGDRETIRDKLAGTVNLLYLISSEAEEA